LTLFQHKYRIETARLKGWDYSNPGAYFVTIVTKDRECIFGEIENGEMNLSDAGKIACQCWSDIPMHFPNVLLDAFIIMPNHVHGIIFITEQNMAINNETMKNGSTQNGGTQNGMAVVETQNFASLPSPSIQPPSQYPSLHFASSKQQPYQNKFGPQSKNLASIVRGFKIGVTKWFRENNVVDPVWQPRFHDHIIRNNESLEKIRNYMVRNPELWCDDKFYNNHLSQ
jgi:putative transposase